MSEARAQSSSLAVTGHRPWALPDRSWLQGQTWRDLLFAHWPVPAEVLNAVLPPGLSVDTYDGQAWVGVTPFEVSGMRPRGLPPLPLLSRFAETNVRTYVTVGGRPGIWFLSLDASQRLAVLAARRLYRLPYFHAAMRIRRRDRDVIYRTERTDGDAALEITYRPVTPPATAQPGSLEHFLTERYALYVVDETLRVLRADIHHRPWPLQEARAEIGRNTMARPYGLDLTGADPLLHYAPRQDVVIWPLRPA